MKGKKFISKNSKDEEKELRKILGMKML